MWTLKAHGINATQEQLLEDLKPHVPLWQEEHGRGALDRASFVGVIHRLGIPSRNHIHTESHEDCLTMFRRHHTRYVMGFVFHRKPTNHALAIVGFQDDFLRLMEPTAGKFYDISYSDLKTNHDADFLLFFASEADASANT